MSISTAELALYVKLFELAYQGIDRIIEFAQKRGLTDAEIEQAIAKARHQFSVYYADPKPAPAPVPVPDPAPEPPPEPEPPAPGGSPTTPPLPPPEPEPPALDVNDYLGKIISRGEFETVIRVLDRPRFNIWHHAGDDLFLIVPKAGVGIHMPDGWVLVPEASA